MDRLAVRTRRGPSFPVYLLFLVGLVAIAAGVAYPAAALLDAPSPGAMVTAESSVDAGSFFLGGTALLLGSCAVALAEVLFLARR